MKFPKVKIIKKTWGREEIIVNNNYYCGKLLIFNPNSNASLHYHVIKHETFYILDGSFILQFIDPKTARKRNKKLKKGDIVVIDRGYSHQLFALNNGGTIAEFSTTDYADDSYRISR